MLHYAVRNEGAVFIFEHLVDIDVSHIVMAGTDVCVALNQKRKKSVECRWDSDLYYMRVFKPLSSDWEAEFNGL